MPLLVIADEVAEALAASAPVVALETSVVSQGLPRPLNFETALAMEQAVRDAGATPATIAIAEGSVHVGLDVALLERFATEDGIFKAGARDLGPLLANRQPGATTVSATMRCAALAGIQIVATGGIGGVHRGAEETFDISADLHELGNTAVAVICSGAKSILDVPKTLEVLETLAVPVIGYATDRFPAFHARDSGIAVDWRVDTPDAAADMLSAHFSSGGKSGALIANPVPKGDAIAPAHMERWIRNAIAAAKRKGIQGKEVTPYLLSAIADASGGQTLRANTSLLQANAGLAGQVAAAQAARGTS